MTLSIHAALKTPSRRIVLTRRLLLVVTALSCTTVLLVALARNRTAPSDIGGTAASAVATVVGIQQRENLCNRISDVRVYLRTATLEKTRLMLLL
jgi:hypothetical protein